MKTVQNLFLIVALLIAGRSVANPALKIPALPSGELPLRLTVQGAEGLFQAPIDGRLLVVLGRSPEPEPRARIGTTGMDADPVIGMDLHSFGRSAVEVPADAAIFPLRACSEIQPGIYWLQAVLMTNRDLHLPNAPGNFYSDPVKVVVTSNSVSRQALILDRQVPMETVPPDTEFVRYLKFPSTRLSAFHHRPMYLRAAITLPMGWRQERDRRYPVLVQIGGYGSRYSDLGPMETRSPDFRSVWLDPKGPRFILVNLDGAGPWGDPYQVNSDNNGPYGDALVQELLPQIESTYRGLGRASGRFLYGGSTGGWVSLALQVFYPDTFGGCWSGYPDSPDFRAFETIDVYADGNAYVNPFGFERPSKRTRFGEIEFSVRHECQLENVMGDQDSFVGSGGQWGAWNAVYSPRGTDGRPVAVWNPLDGTLQTEAIRTSWERYDLRLVLQRNWAVLGPKLRGKIRIWVGDADDYFLDGGTHRLDDFLQNASPPADARIEFGPGKRHGWEPRNWTQLLAEMQAVADAGN